MHKNDEVRPWYVEASVMVFTHELRTIGILLSFFTRNDSHGNVIHRSFPFPQQTSSLKTINLEHLLLLDNFTEHLVHFRVLVRIGDRHSDFGEELKRVFLRSSKE